MSVDFCLKLLFLSHSTSAFTISQIYGEQLLDHWNIFVSGPYGSTSEKDGEFFTDFRQSLNGKSVQPNHWPNGINIRSGGSIDAIQLFYGNYYGRCRIFLLKNSGNFQFHHQFFKID